jgi:hypothetical protein
LNHDSALLGKHLSVYLQAHLSVPPGPSWWLCAPIVYSIVWLHVLPRCTKGLESRLWWWWFGEALYVVQKPLLLRNQKMTTDRWRCSLLMENSDSLSCWPNTSTGMRINGLANRVLFVRRVRELACHGVMIWYSYINYRNWFH